ncbi:MAG: MCP four helix bundle domain-containing protein [Methanosarcinales archaeon]|nr:MCP four helix bundle domain-containing protein [Methanosarcinales archaeon]
MNDIKRIIRRKLLISFLVFSVLMLIIGSISIYIIVTMQENIDEIFENHEPFLSLLTNDYLLINDSYSQTLHFLLTTDYSTRQQIR